MPVRLTHSKLLPNRSTRVSAEPEMPETEQGHRIIVVRMLREAVPEIMRETVLKIMLQEAVLTEVRVQERNQKHLPEMQGMHPTESINGNRLKSVTWKNPQLRMP